MKVIFKKGIQLAFISNERSSFKTNMDFILKENTMKSKAYIRTFSTLTLVTSMVIITGCNTAAIKTGAVLSGNPDLMKGALVMDAHQKEQDKIKRQQQAQIESKRRQAEYEQKQAEHRRVLASMTREERAQYEIQKKKKEVEQTKNAGKTMEAIGNIFKPRPVIVAPY